MHISKQELEQIIKEEIEKELLNEFGWSDIDAAVKRFARTYLPGADKTLRIAGTASQEYLVGAIAGRIISMLGLDPESFLALSVRKGVANIDLKEWKAIVSDTGGRRCFVIADNLMEGVVEALAQKAFNSVANSLTAASAEVAKLMSFAPGGKITTNILAPAAFGITTEVLTNLIKDVDIIQEMENQLAEIVCKKIDEFIS